MMHAFLVVMVVVLVSHHVSVDASTTLQNKGLSCRPPAPACPFSAAQWDSYWREWTCPSTCSDGSTPNCVIEPCSTARCAGACVNNYCPNHPVKGSARCTASCVRPVNCIKDPCHVAPGQPSLCPRGKQCQADYRFGCGFTCEPVTCTWHDEIYQIHDSRPDDDGCNTCSCKPDGTWLCSKKPCRIPTTATPTTAPTRPPIPSPQCPYAPPTLNLPLWRWDCPSTCSDGSQPECLRRPCGPDTCAPGQVCVDNYCPNYPVTTSGRCKAACVTPVNCLKDPCQVANGQPKLCPTGKVCQADYRFGCGFTCEPVTCTHNDQIYQINESRPSDDGCNTCSCTSNGDWVCTLRACLPPTPAPQCPFGPATYNFPKRQWECPSTCSDGSQPNCLVRPCAVTLCAAGTVCVDNYCPNYPAAGNGRCTAKCVTPVNCLKDPCQVANGQPSLCLAGQVCQADYSFGCNYTCQPAP